MISGGADVATVSGLLGHSQVSTTLDIYTHAFDEKKREVSAQMQGRVGIYKVAVAYLRLKWKYPQGIALGISLSRNPDMHQA